MRPARGAGLPATMAVAIVVLALLGFFPSYFARFPRFVGVSGAIHFHVVTLLAWLSLYLLQAVLVRRGRANMHRRLGPVAYGLLPIVAVGIVLAMNDGQRRHKNPDLILATLFDALLFFVLVGLGFWHRRQPSSHRGFMMLSLLPFLNPALGRLISPQLSVPVELLSMIVLLVRARLKREPLRPYVVALIFFFAELGALIAVMVAWPNVPERLWQSLYADGQVVPHLPRASTIPSPNLLQRGPSTDLRLRCSLRFDVDTLTLW